MVTFFEANRTCFLSKVVSIQGRAPRSEFWWFILGSIIVSLIASFLSAIPILGLIVAVVVNIWLFIAQITATIRRFHDLGKSGWWIFLPYGLYLLAVVVMAISIPMQSSVPAVLGAIIIIAGMVSIIYYMVKPGTKGPNQYGADPLENAVHAESNEMGA